MNGIFRVFATLVFLIAAVAVGHAQTLEFGNKDAIGVDGGQAGHCRSKCNPDYCPVGGSYQLATTAEDITILAVILEGDTYDIHFAVKPGANAGKMECLALCVRIAQYGTSECPVFSNY